MGKGLEVEPGGSRLGTQAKVAEKGKKVTN